MILNNKILYSFVFIFILICILFINFNFSFSDEKKIKSPVTEPIKEKFDDIVFATSTNPKYKVILYTDLDCVHCKELSQLLEEKENKFNNMDIYIRNIAFIAGGKSFAKTLYGQCVNRVGGNITWLKFESLAYQSFDIKDDEHFKNIAMKLTTNKSKEFIECIKSEKELELVKNKGVDAVINGIRYIPTVYISTNDTMVKKMDTYNAKSIIKYLKYIDNK